MIELIRKHGQTVAVLACDPQSPRTGGALRGDRFRMPARPDDDGVFIRRVAAQPGQGAIARHLDVMIRLLVAFGFDVVLIETVGAGQGDTAVYDLADVLGVMCQRTVERLDHSVGLAADRYRSKKVLGCKRGEG